ncbi:MAG: hypothetical protein ABW061_27460 [Polyangiaceae bacterium]
MSSTRWSRRSAAGHPGKIIAIERMAALIGWDTLHYDTYPNERFNIWHLPLEYRGQPASRDVDLARGVNFVTAAELKNRIDTSRAHQGTGNPTPRK